MGIAFFGAVIGGFAALLYLARRFKMPPLLMLDAARPAGALGYASGASVPDFRRRRLRNSHVAALGH